MTRRRGAAEQSKVRTERVSFRYMMLEPGDIVRVIERDGSVTYADVKEVRESEGICELTIETTEKPAMGLLVVGVVVLGSAGHGAGGGPVPTA